MSQADFSEEERTKILHFLGYPRFLALGPSIAFGYPQASQPLFIAENAFKQVSPAARAQIRVDVCDLDNIDAKIRLLVGKVEVEQIDKLKLNTRRGYNLLKRERRRLVLQLADDLGAPINPNSKTYGAEGGDRVYNT